MRRLFDGDGRFPIRNSCTSHILVLDAQHLL
jgi:hypothetical protein